MFGHVTKCHMNTYLCYGIFINKIFHAQQTIDSPLTAHNGKIP